MSDFFVELFENETESEAELCNCHGSGCNMCDMCYSCQSCDQCDGCDRSV